MTETPAQTLRRAAGLLRSYANMASPGPWRTHDTHVPAGGYTATVLAGEDNETRPVAWMPSFSNEPNAIDRQAYPDAIYVATMHPGIALLIADQWDQIADDMEILHATEQPYGVTDRSGQTHAAWGKTLTIARAYLGEEAGR